MGSIIFLEFKPCEAIAKKHLGNFTRDTEEWTFEFEIIILPTVKSVNVIEIKVEGGEEFNRLEKIKIIKDDLRIQSYLHKHKNGKIYNNYFIKTTQPKYQWVHVSLSTRVSGSGLMRRQIIDSVDHTKEGSKINKKRMDGNNIQIWIGDENYSTDDPPYRVRNIFLQTGTRHQLLPQNTNCGLNIGNYTTVHSIFPTTFSRAWLVFEQFPKNMWLIPRIFEISTIIFIN